MPEGTGGHQPPRENIFNQQQGEALKQTGKSEKSTPSEKAEAGSFEQQIEQESAKFRENASKVKEQIDGFPELEKIKLSERVQNKLDQIKDKYWDINAKIANWTMTGAVGNTVGLYLYEETIHNESTAEGRREIFQGMAEGMTKIDIST